MEASQEGGGILQEVGDHSGPQAVPPLRQQTKKTTENCDDGHDSRLRCPPGEWDGRDLCRSAGAERSVAIGGGSDDPSFAPGYYNLYKSGIEHGYTLTFERPRAAKKD